MFFSTKNNHRVFFKEQTSRFIPFLLTIERMFVI
jgi:hypothetical protein